MHLADPVTGPAFALRSPSGDDAQFTVALRCEPDVARFLHRVPGDVLSQRAWEEAAISRDDDLPLVIYRRSTGVPEGTIGIYHIDPSLETAEWGRWALRRNSLAAVESVLLAFTLAFDRLLLASLYCTTLTVNTRTLAFHDGLGLTRELTGVADVDGRAEPFVQHRIRKDAWPATQTRLQSLASRIAQMVS